MRINKLVVELPKISGLGNRFLILPQILWQDDGLSSEHIVCEIDKVGHPIDIGKCKS